MAWKQGTLNAESHNLKPQALLPQVLAASSLNPETNQTTEMWVEVRRWLKVRWPGKASIGLR